MMSTGVSEGHGSGLAWLSRQAFGEPGRCGTAKPMKNAVAMPARAGTTPSPPRHIRNTANGMPMSRADPICWVAWWPTITGTTSGSPG